MASVRPAFHYDNSRSVFAKHSRQQRVTLPPLSNGTSRAPPSSSNAATPGTSNGMALASPGFRAASSDSSRDLGVPPLALYGAAPPATSAATAAAAASPTRQQPRPPGVPSTADYSPVQTPRAASGFAPGIGGDGGGINNGGLGMRADATDVSHHGYQKQAKLRPSQHLYKFLTTPTIPDKPVDTRQLFLTVYAHLHKEPRREWRPNKSHPPHTGFSLSLFSFVHTGIST